jgi:hypothetical protein
MPNQPTKLLAVRVPEAERRRIKSLAAIQGLTLQEAVHQAMEAWASKLQAEGTLTLEPWPAPEASTNLQKPKRRRGGKSSQEKRR